MHETGVGGQRGIPHRARADSIVHNLAALVRWVVVAKTSASSFSKALALSASKSTRGMSVLSAELEEMVLQRLLMH